MIERALKPQHHSLDSVPSVEAAGLIANLPHRPLDRVRHSQSSKMNRGVLFYLLVAGTETHRADYK